MNKLAEASDLTFSEYSRQVEPVLREELAAHKPKQGMNAQLGLPRGKMQQYYLAVDIDGTLRDNTVDQDGPPVANEDIRTLLIIMRRSFKNIRIIVWSGSGELYARQVGAAFGLDKYVHLYMSKTEYEEHWANKSIIAIDDIQNTKLGNVANLIVRMK